MKQTIFVSFLCSFFFFNCTKEPAVIIGEPIPFENNNIKIDLITDSLQIFASSIFFKSEQKGLALDFDGKIYMTLNGGRNWTLQYTFPSPNPSTTLYFRQILMVDSLVGYAVGNAILKTIDGGISWQNMYQLQNRIFSSICINPQNELYCISDKAINQTEIFKSSDSGASWNIIDSTTFYLSKIIDNHGVLFCVGDSGKIMRQHAGGWIPYTTATGRQIIDIRFNADGNIGYCIEGYKVFKTTDSGVSWQQVAFFDTECGLIAPITDGNCLLLGAGQYSGGDYGHWPGSIKQTNDFGNVWKETTLSNTMAIQCVHFYSEKEGYGVSGNSLIKLKIKN